MPTAPPPMMTILVAFVMSLCNLRSTSRYSLSLIPGAGRMGKGWCDPVARMHFCVLPAPQTGQTRSKYEGRTKKGISVDPSNGCSRTTDESLSSRTLFGAINRCAEPALNTVSVLSGIVERFSQPSKRFQLQEQQQDGDENKVDRATHLGGCLRGWRRWARSRSRAHR